MHTMLKIFKPLLEEDKKNLRGVHFFLRNRSFGIGNNTQSDRWSNINKRKLTAFYDLANKNMLENKSKHGIFHSNPGFNWTLIDEELNQLEITPKESLIIEITLTIKQSPDTSFAVKIMSYPSAEAASALIVLGGVLALTTALMTLIPPIGAAVAVSTATIAIVGGILLGIGLIMTFATRHCQNKVDNALLKDDSIELTVEQLDKPESRRPISQRAKSALLPHFFSPDKKESDVAEDVMPDFSNN